MSLVTYLFYQIANANAKVAFAARKLRYNRTEITIIS